MIKKGAILLLVLMSFGLSIFFIAMNMQVVEERYGTAEVILWVLPLTMILINSNLLLVSKQKSLQENYLRYKKGLESIFLSLTFLLFIMHAGLLYTVSGNEFNLIMMIPLIVGISLITTANTLPRFQLPEPTSKDQLIARQNTWNKIIRPVSYPMIIGGLLMVASILLPEAFVLPIFFVLLLLTLICIVVVSYRKIQSV